MAKDKILVIVESPTKAKKIQGFLGKDYVVVASQGHVFDLPPDELAVDIKKDFEPKYAIMDKRKDIWQNILQEAKNVKMVYLAGDADREGQALSQNMSDNLPKGLAKKRMTYHEITKKAIDDAVKNVCDMNDGINLYYAYEVRRILDRLAGYKSSFVVQQATGGKSAGRCQSAGLRILVDREKEIIAFVPIVYWPIVAELLTSKNEKIVADVRNPVPLKIGTKEEAEKIIAALKKGPVKVSKFDQKNTKQNPFAPFTTSTLYQAASTILGMSTSRSKVAAQGLYEKSLTTYIRTDSTFIAPDFVDKIRDHIKASFSSTYLPSSSNVYAAKSKNAQEAHEAIRPTDISVSSYTGGTADEKKLYELIWQRTVASQMTPAEYLRTSAEFSCGSYKLGANGSKELFDGYKKVWTHSASNEVELPMLKVGDVVKAIDVKTEKKETQPPSRYSEASFIKTLEKEGIGRPSTYESMCKTLIDRGYVELKSKAYHPTELGIKVVDFMVASDFCFIDVGFTNDTETKLDKIANKELTKLEVLKEFWDRLKKDIDNAKDKKAENAKTTYPCPKCVKNGKKAFLLKKHSKYGAFYSCENYKKDGDGCDYIANVGENGEPVEKVKQVVQKSDKKCPNCGKLLVIRKSKKGNDYLACSDWNKDPKCKGFFDLQGVKMDFSKSKKKWGSKGKNVDVEPEENS